jgi:sugar (pentulose or hexulose) kinase
LGPNQNPDSLFIGVDLGTSGCRAIAINRRSEVVAETRRNIALPRRDGQRVEQDPAVWWDATKKTLSSLFDSSLGNVSPANVHAIAVDGTSGTVLLVDKHGHPLSNALMYNDARAHMQAKRIARIAPQSCAAHGTTSGLAKLLWLQNECDMSAVSYVVTQADWISSKLTNKLGISDQNNCLKLGFDAIDNVWPDWLEKLGVNMNCLPEVVAPGDFVGTISSDIAHTFNLPNDVSIIAGTTDSTAAFMATGAKKPGDAVTSLGSTLVLKTLSSTPVFAPEYGVYSQPLGDNWLVGGGSNSGGAVLLHFFSEEQLQSMTPHLKPDTLLNLDYYPLLSDGERFPVNDSHLAAKLVPRPKNDSEFFQAIIEGIAHIELTGYQRLSALGVPYPQSIRSVGGGAKNKAWQHIRKKLLNVNMINPSHNEAAYGSALLAMQHSQ